MSEHLSWPVAAQKIQEQLDDKLIALETVAPTALERLQGEISGLRFALNLPDEIRKDRERAASSSPVVAPHY